MKNPKWTISSKIITKTDVYLLNGFPASHCMQKLGLGSSIGQGFLLWWGGYFWRSGDWVIYKQAGKAVIMTDSPCHCPLGCAQRQPLSEPLPLTSISIRVTL